MNTTEMENNQETGTPERNELQELLLIQGQFSATEAREVLMNLINSKLSYHNKRNLRSFEHRGESDQHSLKRIAELNELRRWLLAYLKKREEEEEDVSFNIESSIHIEIADDSS